MTALLVAVCPMCHARASLTQRTVEAGGAWRCRRCGQHWDAGRLGAVAAYAAWGASRHATSSLQTDAPGESSLISMTFRR